MLQLLADCLGAAIHFRRHHQPTASGGLGFHQAKQVAVGHRRDWVMTHAGLRQQLFPDEQVALIDRAAVTGSAGETTVKFSPSAASRASVTGPILPCAVLSKVEQYLK